MFVLFTLVSRQVIRVELKYVFVFVPLQVLSPLSDSILAEKTVTVLDDKVNIALLYIFGM